MRLTRQVYAEETHCWLCGQPVDQTLPPNHRRARSVDHIIPVSLGGLNVRSNVRLAHHGCNSARGNRAPVQTNPTSESW